MADLGQPEPLPAYNGFAPLNPPNPLQALWSHGVNFLLAAGGLVLLIGVGFIVGWMSSEHAHTDEYSDAMQYISQKLGQEEAKRFGELTHICKNAIQAKLSCASSYDDAGAGAFDKRISSAVVQPIVPALQLERGHEAQPADHPGGG